MSAVGRTSGHDEAGAPALPDVPTLSEPLDLGEPWLEDAAQDPVPSASATWLAPTLAGLAIAGWTAFYGWAHLTAMQAGAAPAQWASWATQWSVPVALVGIAWLLAMRSSRAEAHRFAATAALMNRESAALEERLKVVNRELSLAREFLAAQSRDLDALGRIAAERLSVHAGELQTLIASNGAQVEAIGSASETALGNMNQLRDDLPVIANAARDVANQIGSAGRVAADQLGQLAGGFDRLTAAGKASEVQVDQVGTAVAETLTGVENQLARIEALIGDRFASLRTEADAYRARVSDLETEALAALRERAHQTSATTDALASAMQAAAQTAQQQLEKAMADLHAQMAQKLAEVEAIERQTSEAAADRIAQLRAQIADLSAQLADRNLALAEAMEQRQAAFDTHETQASEVLAQRLAALDDALSQRRDAQIADAEKLVAQGDALAGRTAELARIIGEASELGETARTSLGTGIGALAQQLADKRAALAATAAQLNELTDSSVRLLEILQSGERTCKGDLTGAIQSANAALENVETRAARVETLMLSSANAGTDLSAYLQGTRAEIDAADSAIAGLRSNLAEGADDALARLQGLRGGFARLAEESGALASETQEALRQSLGRLEAAITQAFSTLEHGAREKMLALANSIGSEAVEVLERALRNESATTLGKLEQSAAHASGVGREAAIQLRDQLVKVNELTGNLEQRVNRARELAEEQVNNDFTRRMALITDSLNSAAIDISGALSTEIADTAWDAYLKGDRGIFTRRAVRLIDNGTARDIAALYSNDDSFKANVSRYIHDFEALLRQTLSTRDGHVLSVTMLGSDMGKLYVALAHAIQRLR